MAGLTVKATELEPVKKLIVTVVDVFDKVDEGLRIKSKAFDDIRNAFEVFEKEVKASDVDVVR